MSYGQNGQRWSSPNRPTSQAADPYGSDQYSYPPVPPRPPAPFDTQATPGASGISNSAELRHPGWLARSLFWAALIVGALPAMVLAPISFNGGRDTAIFFTFGAIVAGGLRLSLGAIAIVLVKNTTWVRRAIGAAIFVLGCLTLLLLGPIMSIVVGVSGIGSADSVVPETVIQSVVSALYLSAVFCGWNIARNRRRWILATAVAIAVVLYSGKAIFDLMLAEQLTGGAMVTVIVQAVWLVVVFGVLGLCHLLGRMRGGTVPLPSRPAPIPHPDYASQSNPQTAHLSQSYPNQWPPGSGQQSHPHH